MLDQALKIVLLEQTKKLIKKQVKEQTKRLTLTQDQTLITVQETKQNSIV